MLKRQNRFYILMALLPPIIYFALWLCYGFPSEGEVTRTVYYAQYAAVLLTIGGIPALLKYITPKSLGERYANACRLRMVLLLAVSVLNAVCYNVLCATPTFFYLGIIAWMSMFFAFPKGEEEPHDTNDKTQEK